MFTVTKQPQRYTLEGRTSAHTGAHPDACKTGQVMQHLHIVLMSVNVVLKLLGCSLLDL